MSWAFANNNTQGAIAASAANTLTATFPYSVTAGDLVVVGFTGYIAGAQTWKVTDSANSTQYSQAILLQSSNFVAAIYWFVAPIGGSSFAVNVNNNGGSNWAPAMAIVEYSFTSGYAVAVDVTNSATGSSGSASDGTVVPTASDLIVGLTLSSGTVSWMGGNGNQRVTNATSGSGYYYATALEDFLNVSSSTTPQQAINPSSPWYGVAAAFSASVAVGPPIGVASNCSSLSFAMP